MEAMKFAFRNLLRKRLRTLITVSGIAVGVISVIIISAIGTAGAKAVNSELDNLGINGISVTSSKGNDGLSISDLETIKEIPGIKTATPIINSYSQATCRSIITQAVIWGIDAGEQVISINSKYGRVLNNSDIKSGANVCLIDINLANSLYNRDNIVGKTITLMINGIYEEYDIVGVVEADSGILSSLMGDVIPTFVYMPYTKLQYLLGTTKLSQIAVKVDENEDYELASKTIRTTLDSSRGHTGIRTENLSKQRAQLGNMLDIIKTVLSAIGGISLLVAGLGIMTVMLVSVHERTREIGIKKAIGAKNHMILMEFLSEALIISLTGSIIGIALGYLATFFVRAFLNFELSIEPIQIILALIIAVTTALIFGVYPASKAAKLRPVDALRQE